VTRCQARSRPAESHAFILGEQGQPQEAFRHHCPETSRLLDELAQQSILMRGTPFSFAFFSTLHPRSEIAPHTAPCNLRLRCHLPLIVPPSSSGESSSSEDAFTVRS
jgi:aspartyl/asparaginyl beta-hydroxylase (cupin superfamily)